MVDQDFYKMVVFFILICVAVFGISYYINNTNVTTVTEIDTVYVEKVLREPYEVTKTITKTKWQTKTELPEGLEDELEKLARERDSINAILGTYMFEKAELDTILRKKDTLYISYDILQKQWYVNMRFGKDSIPTITKTNTITIQKEDSFFERLGYGVVGAVIGGAVTYITFK